MVLPAVLAITGCKKKDQPVRPTAAFQVNTTNPAVNETVTFTNMSENATYYQWDFGDGNISVDENPTHSYDVPGIFQVILKAIGSNLSDTVSSFLNVQVPPALYTIHEGVGISELSIEIDTWQTMQDTFPVTDTAYYSSYEPQYSIYLNQVYYKDLGIVGVFFSEDTVIADSDLLVGLILLPPYPGFTAKNVSVGSKLSAVQFAYGTPEFIDDQANYYGYSYLEQGDRFLCL